MSKLYRSNFFGLTLALICALSPAAETASISSNPHKFQPIGDYDSDLFEPEASTSTTPSVSPVHTTQLNPISTTPSPVLFQSRVNLTELINQSAENPIFPSIPEPLNLTSTFNLNAKISYNLGLLESHRHHQQISPLTVGDRSGSSNSHGVGGKYNSDPYMYQQLKQSMYDTVEAFEKMRIRQVQQYNLLESYIYLVDNRITRLIRENLAEIQKNINVNGDRMGQYYRQSDQNLQTLREHHENKFTEMGSQQTKIDDDVSKLGIRMDTREQSADLQLKELRELHYQLKEDTSKESSSMFKLITDLKDKCGDKFEVKTMPGILNGNRMPGSDDTDVGQSALPPSPF